MKIDRITQSMLRDYKSCPLLFYYRHILKLKLPQKQMNFLFGGAVHKGLEEYHANGRVEYKAIEAFEKEFDASRLSPEEMLDYEKHRKEGIRMLEFYFKSQDYLANVHGLKADGRTEEYFRVKWIDPITGEKLPIPVAGVIDRKVGKTPLDYKTASKAYSQAKTDDLDQATIYSYSVEQMCKHPVREFLYIVFVKWKEIPLQVIKTKRSIQDYALMFREIKSTIMKINKGKFNKGCHGYKENFCDCGKYTEMLKI